MNKLCDDMLREICKYLNVKECVQLEQLMFKSIPETYHLYDLVDYVERKKYEPYIKQVDSVQFHVIYKDNVFNVVVYSENKQIIEKYYIRNVPNASTACSKSMEMFLRAPGYWYGNFYYPFMQYI